MTSQLPAIATALEENDAWHPVVMMVVSSLSISCQVRAKGRLPQHTLWLDA